MRDWENVQDRRAATMLFAKFMGEHPDIQQKCCDDPIEAKRQFAIVGEFYLEGESLPNQPPIDGNLTPIPQKVEFRLFDANDKRRHDLVVMILPSASGGVAEDPADIWIGAWEMWAS
jgi:hypothetical protein